MLKVTNLTKRFGGLAAVDDVSFKVSACEIVGLIGPNGAGKTTLFNVVAGVFQPDGGEIMFDGRSISGLTSAQICKRGLARTFQIPQTFPSMTVVETVMTSAMLHRKDIQGTRASATAVASTVGLARRLDVPVPSLTTAEKKRLEVARALATVPSMILLDEVLAGLNATEVAELLTLIRDLRSSGTTVLFVEHNMEAVMNICDRLVVLDVGRKIADGLPTEVMENTEVIRAYLGNVAVRVSNA